MENIIKLQFDDISEYVPHKLEIQLPSTDIGTIVGIQSFIGEVIVNVAFKANDRNGHSCILHRCKPILRSMIDLDKPLIHPDFNNGEEFIPKIIINKLLLNDPKISWEIITDTKYDSFKIKNDILDVKRDILQLNSTFNTYVKIIKILQKLHFDYNDLINKGLAININTLK